MEQCNCQNARDFKEALTLILDAKGVTVEKLAESLCVDRRTVFRWMLERNVDIAAGNSDLRGT